MLKEMFTSSKKVVHGSKCTTSTWLIMVYRLYILYFIGIPKASFWKKKKKKKHSIRCRSFCGSFSADSHCRGRFRENSDPAKRPWGFHRPTETSQQVGQWLHAKTPGDSERGELAACEFEWFFIGFSMFFLVRSLFRLDSPTTGAVWKQGNWKTISESTVLVVVSWIFLQVPFGFGEDPTIAVDEFLERLKAPVIYWWCSMFFKRGSVGIDFVDQDFLV